MPTDEVSQTIEIDAPVEQVLATIRDVENVPTWVAEILEAELLEEYEDGTPARARFKAAAPVGTDEYTLDYEHADDGMSWSLVSGRLQTGQDACYTLKPLDDDRTEVTFLLRISHHLPLPGFVRHRIVAGLVSSNVTGLKNHLEHDSGQ